MSRDPKIGDYLLFINIMIFQHHTLNILIMFKLILNLINASS